MNHWLMYQKQVKKSYAMLLSALRKPSTFSVKMIQAHIVTWHKYTIISAIQRKLKLCSRNTWTKP